MELLNRQDPGEFREEILKTVTQVAAESEIAGFPHVAAQARRLLTRWEGADNGALIILCKELMGNIQDSLLSRLVFQITPKEQAILSRIAFLGACRTLISAWPL
jgi:hypothetical protein